MNYLLYADDVFLIADAECLQTLLPKSEEHSFSLGYHWVPKKCVVVYLNLFRLKYYLHSRDLPSKDSFTYLGAPIKSASVEYKQALLQQNINKALKAMKQLITFGLNKKWLNYLFSTRFFAQIVRSQLEYGLAITFFNLREIRSIENCQNQYMLQIFGGRPSNSTIVMLHLGRLLTTKDRISIIQAQLSIQIFLST